MKLWTFDMDGTLTQVTSAVYLCQALGLESEILELESRIARREIRSPQFLQSLGKLVSGVSLNRFRKIYNDMPVLDDMQEGVARIHSMGDKAAIVTLGVGTFAEFMKDQYGFDYISACTTLLDGNYVTGFGPPYIIREEKEDEVKRLCGELRINPNDCIAVGDSMSDVHMFRAAGTSIAVNYSPDLEGHTTHYIKPCTSLNQIIEIAN